MGAVEQARAVVAALYATERDRARACECHQCKRRLRWWEEADPEPSAEAVFSADGWVPPWEYDPRWGW